MEKTINLELNNYSLIPHSLRIGPSQNVPASIVTVNLASLFHHYYLDSFERVPPCPDPAQFEHVRFLLPVREFRFQGGGLGNSTAIRRHRSTELGQAFLRWFLHDHLNITYFAHMEHVLNRQLHRAFNTCRIERTAPGDAPDYFCAENVSRVFLGEAKGRYTSISFKNKEFASWRGQFTRVVFKDSFGSPRSIKGHIIATRFATEEDSPRIQSSLFAEDPETAGDQPLGDERSTELGAAIRSLHYSGISTKLAQPVLATALSTGLPIPEELRIPVFIWEMQLPPLQGKRFVGGYFPAHDGVFPFQSKNGRIVFSRADPLRLDSGTGTFFGVEENIFRQLVALARSGDAIHGEITTFDELQPFYSGFSALRDGSVLGPVEFFRPIEQALL